MSDPRKVLPGVKLGDRRVRVERPLTRYFRYGAPGVLSAKLCISTRFGDDSAPKPPRRTQTSLLTRTRVLAITPLVPLTGLGSKSSA